MFKECCPHRHTPHVRFLLAKLEQAGVVAGMRVSQENTPELQWTFAWKRTMIGREIRGESTNSERSRANKEQELRKEREGAATLLSRNYARRLDTILLQRTIMPRPPYLLDQRAGCATVGDEDWELHR